MNQLIGTHIIISGTQQFSEDEILIGSLVLYAYMYTLHQY